MEHLPIVSEQLSAVSSVFPDCVYEVKNSILTKRERTNFDLINVIAGIYLGTIFQNVGSVLDTTDFTPGYVSGRIGFSLVRTSFTIGRIFSVDKSPLECDFNDPREILNGLTNGLESTCGSSMYKGYKAQSLALTMQNRLSCLSSGSSVGTTKLSALTGLYKDFELMLQTS